MKLTLRALDPRVKRGLAIALAVLLAGGASLLLFPWGKAAHHSAYDEGLSHLSLFRSELEAAGFTPRTIVSTPLLLADIADARDHLYVAVGVERAYTDDEVEAIVAFTERGGRVLVMDDFQRANDLSTRFGVQFDGNPLLDRRFNESPQFVRADGAVGDRSFPNLLLSGPSTLQEPDPTVPVRYLVNSSTESYSDLDGNGEVSDRDAHGPFPVAVAVGDPVVAIFVADASLLTDDLLTPDAILQSPNRAFGLALVTMLVPDGAGTVYFDESRHANGAAEPTYRALALAVGAARSPFGLVTLSLAAVGAAALLVWTAFRDADRRHQQVLSGLRPRDLPESEQRALVHVILKSRLETLANVEDGAAYARAHSAEAARLLKDSALAAFVSAGPTGASAADWARVLEAAGRDLE